MLSRSARAARIARLHRHSSYASSSTPALYLPARSVASTSTRQTPQSAWAEATESAHSVLTPPPSSLPTSHYDPLGAIYEEIGSLKSSLFNLLGSSHPSLDTVAKYYFQAEGKHLRPLLVLLISQATNGLAENGWEEAKVQAGRMSVDDSLTSRGGVLNDWNPEQMGNEADSVQRLTFSDPFTIPASGSSSSFESSSLSSSSNSSLPPPPSARISNLSSDTTTTDTSTSASSIDILPTQRRLASITEMIHVASLLHDDVIDDSSLRRGSPSAPSTFGNKLSILSGDFLLGRASVALARLGSREVVELLATVIANLVEGEVMQLRATSEPEREPTPKGFEEYMRKTYLKTASLMAKSARAAVILGGCSEKQAEWVKDVAYGYGRNLGIAFQLVDDALDYLPTPASLGKPGFGADLSLGLATAPALFAWKQHPELGPLILRKFANEGDVETARNIVAGSDGVQQTIALARDFAKSARELVLRLPESPAREALVGLTLKVVDRVK